MLYLFKGDYRALALRENDDFHHFRSGLLYVPLPRHDHPRPETARVPQIDSRERLRPGRVGDQVLTQKTLCNDMLFLSMRTAWAPGIKLRAIYTCNIPNIQLLLGWGSTQCAATLLLPHRSTSRSRCILAI